MLHEKKSKFVMQTLFCHGEDSLMLPYVELPVGNHTHHDITLTNGIQPIDKIVKTGSIQIINALVLIRQISRGLEELSSQL